VTLRYVLPVAEAERLTGVEVPVLTVSKLGDYVLAHVAVSSGEDCPAIDQGYDLGKVDPLQVGAGLYGFEIMFRCAELADTLTLHDHALFDRFPQHVDFARIEHDGRSVQQLFTGASEHLRVPLSKPAPAAAPAQYGELGLTHVLRGADRLCLLLGALLLVRRRRELGFLVAALASGYLLSLAAQATGAILPRMAPIEAFVGFLIALLAAAIALRETAEPHRAVVAIGWPALLLILALGAALAHVAPAALVLLGAALISGGLLALYAGSGLPALVCAGVFGFLDGFTLPSMLEPLQLAVHTEVPMVAAYDAGALLAAGVLLTLVAAAFVLVRIRWWAIPRSLVNDLAAAGLGCIGTFWFLTRLHS
jgi:hypothetical protein